jgi:hypothetical protein
VSRNDFHAGNLWVELAGQQIDPRLEVSDRAERDSDEPAVELHVIVQRQVENMLEIMMQEPLAGNRLEMSEWPRSYGCGFDPGYMVLQDKALRGLTMISNGIIGLLLNPDIFKKTNRHVSKPS